MPGEEERKKKNAEMNNHKKEVRLFPAILRQKVITKKSEWGSHHN